MTLEHFVITRFCLRDRRPAFDFSVFGPSHVHAETYGDFLKPPPDEHGRLVRQWFLQAAWAARAAHATVATFVPGACGPDCWSTGCTKAGRPRRGDCADRRATFVRGAPSPHRGRGAAEREG